MKQVARAAAFSGLLLASAADSAAREWTDLTGKFLALRPDAASDFHE